MTPQLPISVIYVDGHAERLDTLDQISLYEDFELFFDSADARSKERTGIAEILDNNRAKVHLIVDKLAIEKFEALP